MVHCRRAGGKLNLSAAAHRLTRGLTRVILALATLPACCGCQVLGIPSYRVAPNDCADAGGGYVAEYGPNYDPNCGELPGGCVLPGFLGECIRRHHAKKSLPSAPEYPRFHPLPTRPMFEPLPEPDAYPVAIGPAAAEIIGSPEAMTPGAMPLGRFPTSDDYIAAQAAPLR